MTDQVSAVCFTPAVTGDFAAGPSLLKTSATARIDMPIIGPGTGERKNLVKQIAGEFARQQNKKRGDDHLLRRRA
ncbi:hypothetical protein [Bradyrhizobium sp. USDA 3364]